jgi:hypothetical protein
VLELTRITYIYWQIECTPNLHLWGCLILQKKPTSIDQLNAFQKCHLNDYFSLQELPTSVGQLNAFEKLDLGRGCA